MNTDHETEQISATPAMTRACGILMPVFSLPSEGGIGCFSKEAFEFVDFLSDAGQRYWQILPMGPTGYGDSPYQPFSAFAGNPYFIAPDDLVRRGWLTADEVKSCPMGSDVNKVDYGALYEHRYVLLHKAYDRFLAAMAQGEKADNDGLCETFLLKHAPAKPETAKDPAAEAEKENGADPAANPNGDPNGNEKPDLNVNPNADLDKNQNDILVSDKAEEPADPVTAALCAISDRKDQKTLKEDYEDFLKESADWLEDYVLFTAVKQSQGGKSWQDWDAPLRLRDTKALAEAAESLKDEMDFQRFLQYVFERQWEALHTYATARGVAIIGDIPFYMAPDSADVWSHPELFQMDEDRIPTGVAGCAPDVFSATGQLWGNPLYDWDYQKTTSYEWWMRRMARNAQLADVLRYDHFHGFAAYYDVPYGDETAENGKMHDGPGMDFFLELKRRFGELPIIAEDLGVVTPKNQKLLRDSGFPGMKVLQFAFGAYDSEYLNHHHIKNCVVYTGTHDNPTIREWLGSLSDGERAFVRAYIHSEFTDEGGFVWDFIREAYRSVADLCIIPLQDYLVKGKEARINTPSVAWGNWQWRLEPNFLSRELAKSIRGLAELYRRTQA